MITFPRFAFPGQSSTGNHNASFACSSAATAVIYLTLKILLFKNYNKSPFKRDLSHKNHILRDQRALLCTLLISH